MRLLSARVTKYRSIDDSSQVTIDPDVTCLVGKNESGKTNFLKALYLLNPVESEKFVADLDYPRKDWANYKNEHDRNPAQVVEAEFELDDEEVAAFKEEFGPDSLEGRVFTASKDYANKPKVVLKFDETATIRHFLEKASSDSNTARRESLKLASDLQSTIAALKSASEPAVKGLAAKVIERFPKTVEQTLVEWVWKRSPRFVYFSDYQFMPGTASVPYLVDQKSQKRLTVPEITLLRLIARAGLTLDELRDEKNYERHVANLEAGAISITREVFRYWTQNKNLNVKFATSGPVETDTRLQRGPLIRIRVENTRHGVTVPFDERSRGFVWFFSFLAYFNEIEKSANTDLVLLLDEPGLSLHATAQADLLRFIEERLTPNHQVLYSTHSPFMVDARRLNRARTVQDMEDAGTVVGTDIFRNDEATLFPLQAALGFEITQTLFIGPNSLLVEGPSEVLYLPQVSGQLAAEGREALDPRWTLTPIGGIDKASTLVSLFRPQKIHVAVLMDYAKHQNKLVEELRGTLGQPNVIALHDFREGRDTDIEDLFDTDDYLSLVNVAYKRELRGPLKVPDLTHSSDRIVERLAHYFEAQQVGGGRFSHGRVALEFASRSDEFGRLSATTLASFEAVFRHLNGLLPRMRSTTGGGTQAAPNRATRRLR